MVIRVAINGFGRIGRAFARLSHGRDIEIVAVALAVSLMAVGAIYWRTSGTDGDTSVAAGTSFPDIYTSPLLIDLTDLAISILHFDFGA